MSDGSSRKFAQVELLGLVAELQEQASRLKNIRESEEENNW